MKCTDCSYFYPDRNDKGYEISEPHCQYPYDDGYAPCEIEENIYTEEN